jgi:hypothetical protein
MSSLLRNYFFFGTYLTAIKIRKVLLTAIYDKIGKLSMASIIETNSGKLITLISSDYFSVERTQTMSYYVISSPILNIFAYVLIGITVGYEYALMTFAFWIVQLVF